MVQRTVANIGGEHMAVIIQRRKIFTVIYQCEDNKKVVPKLEAFFSIDQALIRKDEIEKSGLEIQLISH